MLLDGVVDYLFVDVREEWIDEGVSSIASQQYLEAAAQHNFQCQV